jgi:hypothetical protein
MRRIAAGHFLKRARAEILAGKEILSSDPASPDTMLHENNVVIHNRSRLN